MRLSSLYILLLLVFPCIINAQQPDSVRIQMDTIKTNAPLTIDEQAVVIDSNSVVKKKRLGFVHRFFDDYPNPKKSALLSLVVPGTGQIYNKKYLYIKLPVIYGTLGFFGYLIGFNTNQYRDFRDQHLFRVDDDETTVDRFEGIYSDNDLRRIRDQARKNMELSYIGFFFAYTLQAVEAFVSAHLLTFDVNDDLSLQVSPRMQYMPDQQTAMGVGLRLQFQKPVLPKKGFFE